MSQKIRKMCCGQCDYGLMMVNDDQNIVSLKYKDLYFWFRHGLLILVCRGCSARNMIVEKEYEVLYPEVVRSEEARAGTVRAVVKEWVRREDYKKDNATNWPKGDGQKANLEPVINDKTLEEA